jgi:hypothetical protein
VSSIGVKMPVDQDFGHLYSQRGIEYLGECLRVSLSRAGKFEAIDVCIRGRYVVVSKPFKETPWVDKESYDYAVKYGVRLWTRENLEPTISAVQFNLPAEDTDTAADIEN